MFSPLAFLNVLHILNDGYQASFLLLLPFIARDLHISLTQIGTLGSFFYLFETVFAIPAGYLGERMGGMRIILLAALLYGAGFLGLSFVGSFAAVVPFFILAGIGFALFHPLAFSLVASWSTKEKRGRNLGDFTAIGDLGRIGISAALTYLAVAIGWRPTASTYGLVVFALFTASLLFLRTDKNRGPESGTPEPVGFKTLIGNRAFILACITAMFDTAASSSLFIFLPFLLLAKHIPIAVLGSFTGAFFVGNFLGKSLIGRLTDKWGSVRTFIIAELLMAGTIVLLTNSSSIIPIIVFSILLGALTKGTVPARASMAVEAVEHHARYEKAVGILSFISSIGTAGAPLLYGWLADSHGITSAFYASAVIAVLATIPAIAFRRAKRLQ